MPSARSTRRSQKAFGARDLVGVVHVDQQREVEVAVADMADDRRQQTLSAMSCCVCGHAFGEPRDRHADIGRERPARPAAAERRQ